MTLARTFGLILAGGRARRLGGGDKGLLALGGRPILQHIVDRLSPQVSPVLLNANGDPARFAGFGMTVLADTVPGRPGPLAGILVGLECALPCTDWLLTVPGDTPFLPPDLAARLDAARRAAGAEIACAASDGMLHPVIALWPVALAPALRAYLAAGHGKVGTFARGFRLARADWPGGPDDPFSNINTPADLVAAERRMATAAGFGRQVKSG